jgi:hypothetical protein
MIKGHGRRCWFVFSAATAGRAAMNEFDHKKKMRGE